MKHNKQEKGELAVRESIAVVPLALPLMAGPGAISSVIVYASQSHWQQLLGMSVVVVVFSFCSWLIFRAAPLLFKIMGNTGINVVTRIMGLIMMSLGIEIMVAGIKGVFPQPDVSQLCFMKAGPRDRFFIGCFLPGLF